MKPLGGYGRCGRPVVATFTCVAAHADHLPLCQHHLGVAMTHADTLQNAYKSRYTPYVTSGCHFVLDPTPSPSVADGR